MKISCEKYLLQAAVATVSRAAAAKSPIPALEGILLEAGAELKLTGYDLKKGIYTTVPADIEELGSAVINARFLGEVLRRLPDGIVVIEENNKAIHLRCGKSEYNFAGLETEDYPELSRVDEIQSISLPQKILKNMIDQTIFAVADNDIRPIYTGILFEVENNELTLVAVDGYRLAKRKETIDNFHMEDCKFVVPGSALTDVGRICEDSDEEVKISLGDKHVAFFIGNTVLISRRLEGEFMNYKKSIPTMFRYHIEVEREELMKVIDRVALIVKEKNANPIHMIFNENVIDCFCSTVAGKAEDSCICSGNGDGFEIGFNDRYLMDALKAAGAEKISVNLNTASSPCILEAAEGESNFTYMILPVRLRAGE